ncbi:MAG: hypothetical protein OXH52_19655 [Gammaproteobacteria bacterium]|nr:hypothetical protein [Gammaproteobacteria bacterium]
MRDYRRPERCPAAIRTPHDVKAYLLVTCGALLLKLLDFLIG